MLGPWTAILSISIALLIQAVFFGDGGILALGANIFNIGIVLPFISYFVYKLIATKSRAGSKRRWIAAAIAGYIGITAAAMMAGIEFGLQPLLFHSATGVPLYCPYGLGQALPAMLFAHLTVAGPIEGVITALVLRYLQQSNPAFLDEGSARDKAPLSWKRFLPWLAVLEEVLGQLATDREHRVKWLVQLMDIDDELEELERHDKMRIIDKVKGSERIEESQKPHRPQKSEQRGGTKTGRTRGVVFVLSSGEKRA